MGAIRSDRRCRALRSRLEAQDRRARPFETRGPRELSTSATRWGTLEKAAGLGNCATTRP